MNTTTEEVVRALQMLSGKADASYAPNIPPVGYHVSVKPLPEEVSDTLDKGNEHAAGYAVLAGISYKSISGNFKNRDFLIRRVVKTKTDMYIDGMAMDIRAPRLIKVSSVSQIRDVGSGRFYDNPYKFLQDRLGINVSNDILPEPMNGFSQAIERLHNEITVLMYVVALDGIREKTERRTVADFVRSHTTDLKYSDQELDEYLISVAPDSQSAGVAFQHILAKDKESIQVFIEALIGVIMADGKVAEKERVFLAKVMSLLQSQGFQFNFGL
ncbi:MAG: TerB family tellurite resistance protein [Alphaproteobacteria bacterium]